MTSKNDPVNHPSHYTSGRFETIDVIEDIIQHYENPVHVGLVWQTIKYLARAPLKGSYEQDLKKAHFYLSRLVGQLGATVRQDPPEHDGCSGCKHENKLGIDEPCRSCRGSADPRDYHAKPRPDLFEFLEDDRK